MAPSCVCVHFIEDITGRPKNKNSIKVLENTRVDLGFFNLKEKLFKHILTCSGDIIS